MGINLNNTLSVFKIISLTELNENSSCLERIDKKYLLPINKLEEVLNDFKNDFFILEINGIKIFSYENIYMDSNDYLFYNQHQNKETSRTKIRTRFYIDSNSTFFEYKQKKDGITNKYRYDSNNDEHGKMTIGKEKVFKGLWKELYKTGENIPKIFPSIKTNYKRITLVNKNGGERITIDFDIKISNLRDEKNKELDLTNLAIIEIKSLKQKCESEKIINSYHITKADSCSKYSLGIIYFGLTKKYSTFRKTIKKIEEIKETKNYCTLHHNV